MCVDIVCWLTPVFEHCNVADTKVEETKHVGKKRPAAEVVDDEPEHEQESRPNKWGRGRCTKCFSCFQAGPASDMVYL